MNLLDREQIKTEIVSPALSAVADYNGDIEGFTFQHFHDFSMEVFLGKIKSNLNDKGFDVLLNSDVAGDWTTIKDCIEYIYDEHTEL